MLDLTIEGVPESLHARLNAQAELNYRSLSAEAIACLERGLAATVVGPREMRARLSVARERAGGYLTETLVSRGKREGRA